MKIRFKSEEAMKEFAKLSIGYSSHNKNLVMRHGMNEFEVCPDEFGEWWDTVDGDFTINVKEERKYFEIV
ncbi:hypothetical protein ZPAH1_orf00020 [Aeromonas phage ZPAH1]|nr:hypothetical protein ZPAH1_orf00020 [Aeromonas phage ZPAH1]